MATMTETEALVHHFPEWEGISGDTLIDAARGAFVLHVCLECGTIQVAPDAVSYEAMRGAFIWCCCCADGDCVEY